MSGITLVANLGTPPLEGTSPTLRPSAQIRARSSVVDESARITAVYEQTIQDLRGLLATIKGDSASLKQDLDVSSLFVSQQIFLCKLCFRGAQVE